MSLPTNRARLLEIWSAFVEHQRPQLAQTTMDQVYGKITARLNQMPDWIDSGQDVVDWLAQTKRKPDSDRPRWSYDSQRRTLERLKCATAWAAKTRRIRRDPFEYIENYPNRSKSTDSHRAFTPNERSAIISAARIHLEPHQRRWIQALFYTGCRPSELRALKREHWTLGGQQLRIVSAFPWGIAAPQPTKNRKTTPDYPCNAQLQALLAEALEGAQGNAWIFREPDGSPFEYRRFQVQVFKPFMVRLAESGQIAYPLSQYHARHTWITSALETMAIADVAYLARTSPKIIMQHYAGRSRTIAIPEF